MKLRNFKPHQENSVVYLRVNSCTSKDCTNRVVGVCFVGQDVTPEKEFMHKFVCLQGDYKAIIESLNPLIPPIFSSDENACCSEWNAVMEQLSGWKREEVIGKTLPGEIFGGLCRLRGQDDLTKFMILLYRGIGGQDTEKFAFGFCNRNGDFIEVLLTVNKRTDADGNIIGCFCFVQIVTPERQQALQGYGQEDKKYVSKLKELAYVLQEIKNPLNGIRFAHKLLENTSLTANQKKMMETCNACDRQIMTIINDMELQGTDQG